jgi:hypothetical protein
MRVHPNRHRGEIAARLDGEIRLLCLTLGALAELETAFGVANLAELAERFESGRLSAGDIIKIVGAGIARRREHRNRRGCGADVGRRRRCRLRQDRGGTAVGDLWRFAAF